MFKVGDRVQRHPSEISWWWKDLCGGYKCNPNGIFTVMRVNGTYVWVKELPSQSLNDDRLVKVILDFSTKSLDDYM